MVYVMINFRSGSINHAVQLFNLIKSFCNVHKSNQSSLFTLPACGFGITLRSLNAPPAQDARGYRGAWWASVLSVSTMKALELEFVFVLLLGLGQGGMLGRSGGFLRRQQLRLPLYMKLLYRTMRIMDRTRTQPARGERIRGLHHSDSVINIVAKGESSFRIQSVHFDFKHKIILVLVLVLWKPISASLLFNFFLQKLSQNFQIGLLSKFWDTI